MTRFLCALGLHHMRDVSRPGTPLVVHVCRRGCGMRREYWPLGRGDS